MKAFAQEPECSQPVITLLFFPFCNAGAISLELGGHGGGVVELFSSFLFIIMFVTDVIINNF